MLSYCLKCKKNNESINRRVSKTSNGRTMMLSKCVICGSKQSKFIKQQQAKGLLSNLGIRTLLNKIPSLEDILFLLSAIPSYKMNDIINKFLLAGEKFMPEMHLRQPKFTYSVVDHLLSIKKEFKSLKNQVIQNIFTEVN